MKKKLILVLLLFLSSCSSDNYNVSACQSFVVSSDSIRINNKAILNCNKDEFILENIIKNGSDFKVSIETDKLKEFLRIILQNKIANLNSKRAK